MTAAVSTVAKVSCGVQECWVRGLASTAERSKAHRDALRAAIQQLRVTFLPLSAQVVPQPDTEIAQAAAETQPVQDPPKKSRGGKRQAADAEAARQPAKRARRGHTTHAANASPQQQSREQPVVTAHNQAVAAMEEQEEVPEPPEQPMQQQMLTLPSEPLPAPPSEGSSQHHEHVETDQHHHHQQQQQHEPAPMDTSPPGSPAPAHRSPGLQDDPILPALTITACAMQQKQQPQVSPVSAVAAFPSTSPAAAVVGPAASGTPTVISKGRPSRVSNTAATPNTKPATPAVSTVSVANGRSSAASHLFTGTPALATGTPHAAAVSSTPHNPPPATEQQQQQQEEGQQQQVQAEAAHAVVSPATVATMEVGVGEVEQEALEDAFMVVAAEHMVAPEPTDTAITMATAVTEDTDSSRNHSRAATAPVATAAPPDAIGAEEEEAVEAESAADAPVEAAAEDAQQPDTDAVMDQEMVSTGMAVEEGMGQPTMARTQQPAEAADTPASPAPVQAPAPSHVPAVGSATEPVPAGSPAAAQPQPAESVAEAPAPEDTGPAPTPRPPSGGGSSTGNLVSSVRSFLQPTAKAVVPVKLGMTTQKAPGALAPVSGVPALSEGGPSNIRAALPAQAGGVKAKVAMFQTLKAQAQAPALVKKGHTDSDAPAKQPFGLASSRARIMTASAAAAPKPQAPAGRATPSAACEDPPTHPAQRMKPKVATAAGGAVASGVAATVAAGTGGDAAAKAKRPAFGSVPPASTLPTKPSATSTLQAKRAGGAGDPQAQASSVFRRPAAAGASAGLTKAERAPATALVPAAKITAPPPPSPAPRTTAALPGAPNPAQTTGPRSVSRAGPSSRIAALSGAGKTAGTSQTTPHAVIGQTATPRTAATGQTTPRAATGQATPRAAAMAQAALQATSTGCVTPLVAKAPGAAKTSTEHLSYHMTPWRRSSSGDDDDSDSGGQPDVQAQRKPVPQWALAAHLMPALQAQERVDPESVFGRPPAFILADVFAGMPPPPVEPPKSGKMPRRANYSKRTSSGNWMADRVTWQEELRYKRAMGYLAQSTAAML